MSNRFVRSSKYRHVFGRPTRKEQCYDNLRVSRNAWDTNLIKVNPKYISVNWEASGGGTFGVIPLEERGKLPEKIPLFRGHTAVVLDTDWNPFNDDLIVSGSDDGKIFLWRVPEDFTLHSDLKPDEIQDVKPVGKLSGHSKKVGHVLFNPAAENVLASASGDFTVKLWDIESGSTKLTLPVGEIIQSLSWSANGSLLATTSRDKKLRIWDTRQQKAAHEVNGHGGAKNSRAVWMGEHDRIATTGFSKMSDRQLALWDIRAPSQPVNGFEMLDSISGVCMPFWDEGTQCLYLAGKGDGNIRYYEYANDKFEFLSEYKSADPQRGVAFLPKRGVNMHENEVTRAYKTVNDTYIEPISFIVPRRSETFQEDIYPPTVGLKPAMSNKEWFEGGEAVPPKFSMESLYEGDGMKEVSASEVKQASKTPVASTTTEPKVQAKKEAEPAAPETKPTTRAPPPSMKEQGGSMAAMVGKYADKGPAEQESDDDDSSFEEVSKPVERTTITRSVPSAATKTESAPSPAPIPAVSKVEPKPTSRQVDVSTPKSASVGSEGPFVNTGIKTDGGKPGDLQTSIDRLTTMVTDQSQQISQLTKLVQDLMSEVKTLKG